MRTFKDTKYGDLTGQKYETAHFGINVNDELLTSLEGSPDEVTAYYSCDKNRITSLKYAPKIIGGTFYCRYNKSLKNPRQQIIDNRILAKGGYKTDDGDFTYDEILKEMSINKNIKSKGFRTLLGLKNEI